PARGEAAQEAGPDPGARPALGAGADAAPVGAVPQREHREHLRLRQALPRAPRPQAGRSGAWVTPEEPSSARERSPQGGPPGRPLPWRMLAIFLVPLAALAGATGLQRWFEGPVPTDRKSTRLNSSHLGTS